MVSSLRLFFLVCVMCFVYVGELLSFLWGEGVMGMCVFVCISIFVYNMYMYIFVNCKL